MDSELPGILIVDDNEDNRYTLQLLLESDGHERIASASGGNEAIALLDKEKFHLVLLDMMMPDLNGDEVLKIIKGNPDTRDIPVVMISADSDTEKVSKCIELGADDYVTKPFVAKELAARIRALLRRARPAEEEPGALTFGDLQLLPEQGLLRRLNGDEVHCTRTEFRLLCELAASPNKVLSREQLLDRVWGYDYFGDGRLVDVHIRRLRTKVEADPAVPQHILTVRGMGYKLVP